MSLPHEDDGDRERKHADESPIPEGPRPGSSSERHADCRGHDGSHGREDDGRHRVEQLASDRLRREGERERDKERPRCETDNPEGLSHVPHVEC